MHSGNVLRLVPRAKLPGSVQLLTRATEHPATGVLDYLSKCEHAAALCGRRDLVSHYQECWRLVFTQLNGLLPLPILQFTPRPLCPEPLAQRLKGWERDKYSKPVRRVVSIREERASHAGGRVHVSSTTLVLECGHEVDAGPLYDANYPPKRRRCAKCSSAVHATRVELQRLKGTRA